ncbi:MAG: ParB/RepB/Spo0J family partition protein [Nitrospirae bacterium]|nr:ParB/RepB/Spo0J family partition protein [Nitrospirota bacterium]
MKPALGKGLSALIPEQKKGGDILEIDIGSIAPNDYQPRRFFDDRALDELAASIKEKGVIQPVIVRRVTEGSYQLIAGERRWRAAAKAGLVKIPVVIKEAAPEDTLEIALIENIQREDLNPLETADAFQRLIRDFNLTHEDVSKKVGKDRATVTNYLRILKLPADVKRWIAEGSLSMGHAKALLQIDDPAAQTAAAKKIIQNGLSVREAEALGRKTSKTRPRPKPGRDPQIASLEEKLIQSLGTKVRLIHKGKKRGKIEIEYYSLEELDRLLEILVG